MISEEKEEDSMKIATKEYIEEFHEAEGQGLDAAPIVEAARLAYQLLEILNGIKIEVEDGEDNKYWIVFSPSGGSWAGHAGIPITEEDPFRLLMMKAWEANRREVVARANPPESEEA